MPEEENKKWLLEELIEINMEYQQNTFPLVVIAILVIVIATAINPFIYGPIDRLKQDVRAVEISAHIPIQEVSIIKSLINVRSDIYFTGNKSGMNSIEKWHNVFIENGWKFVPQEPWHNNPGYYDIRYYKNRDVLEFTYSDGTNDGEITILCNLFLRDDQSLLAVH